METWRVNSNEFYTMTPVDLSQTDQLNNITGEMWGIAVLDSSRIIAVGVDQSRNEGLIFAYQHNPYDARDYHKFEVSTLLPETSSWLRGVCGQGDRIVAVGEKTTFTQWNRHCLIV